jgi:very-short-patch-repair endonuclease
VDRKLVVEADGLHHDLSETDETRDTYLRQLGYRVLRFQNKDIAWYPEWVVDEIRRGLGAPLPPAPPAVPSPRKRGD